MTTTTTDMMALDLASVIRNRREQLRLSQVAAAKRSGVSRSTWIDLEAGNRPAPQTSTLDRIDEALEWQPGTLRSLIGRTTPNVDNFLYATTNAMRQELVAYATTLSKAQVEQVLQFVHSMTGLNEEPNVYDQMARIREEIRDLTTEFRAVQAAARDAATTNTTLRPLRSAPHRR